MRPFNGEFKAIYSVAPSKQVLIYLKKILLVTVRCFTGHLCGRTKKLLTTTDSG